jgi:hypothetical protein
MIVASAVLACTILHGSFGFVREKFATEGPWLPFPHHGALCFAEYNSRFGHVVGRNLDFDSDAWHDSNKILSHFAADVSQDLLSVGQINAQHRIGKHFRHDALRDQRFFLRQ